MTVNIEGLIHGLGKSYQELVSMGLISYKSPPTGCSGSSEIFLHMVKEGIILSFARTPCVLQRVTLTLLRKEIKNWNFSNQLPFGLNAFMTMSKIHMIFGPPLKQNTPKMFMKRTPGRVDLYSIASSPTSISMQIRYDREDRVESVLFFPASAWCW